MLLKILNSAAPFAVVRKLVSPRPFGVMTVRNLSGDYHQGVPEQYKSFVRIGMNDDGYPLPTLTYKESYDRKQAKYNKYLIASSIFFLSMLTLCFNSDTFSHLAPPPRQVRMDTWNDIDTLQDKDFESRDYLESLYE